MKNVQLRIRVDEYTNLKLEEIARTMNVDKSTVARAAIVKLLNQVVDENGDIKKTDALEAG